ncbi:hypothetical protein CGCA056_v005615 [Colletotrichum aenigma]|uniref:uncharacterized protein n=1 Tax=Colletotrichum aenigma TaxID=1215731 RepID=UPI001872B596|nr:uncharacterized protein CGCA056_v005615 [Colletotrichum aenigma]KAF5523208.1 hypothetical protein CGCA056_v005615 [Colletotrichum aenigma]
MSHLFRLPRELREIIYGYYITVDGGYLCDTDAFVTGRLKGIDGQPINIALIYTCKTIAEEMDRGGLAMRLNAISFTTLYSPDLSTLAKAFQQLMNDGLEPLRDAMLKYVGYHLSESSILQLKGGYPYLAPVLDRLKSEEPPERLGHERSYWTYRRNGPYGEVPSTYREFVKDALCLAADEPEASRAIRDFVPAKITKAYRADGPWTQFEIVNARSEAWDVPSTHEMNELISLTKDETTVSFDSAESDPVKYRFSAAAAAIYFLKSVPCTLRPHLRKIILLEDAKCISYPESHDRGLIPFCQDNPLLRVERRVKLWTNVFLTGMTYDAYLEWQCAQQTGQHETGVLYSDQITAALGPWIVEAAALVGAGMPPASFSLLLESGGAPELCSQIFQSVLHRDIAWQQAWIESARNGTLDLSWFGLRGKLAANSVRERDHVFHAGPTRGPQNFCDFAGYFFEELPRVVREMGEGSSIIRCDFEVGTPLDFQAIVDDHKHWGDGKWIQEWSSHSPAIWKTVSPLPDWKTIVKDNLVLSARAHWDDSRYYT